jgi:two-component system nitrogen regulation response regulator GlnG
VAARLGRFPECSGGTLFLDEIGDMPIELQAKLLRVLQFDEVTPVGASASQPVDVRIVAATHRDLDAAVRDGTFREDLVYRLRVVRLHISPLRDRIEDIPILAEHFVARWAEGLSAGTPVLADATVERLCAHAWPGNVRELENAIKRALVLASSDVLAPEDFAFLERSDGESGGSDSGLADLIRKEVEARLASADPREIYRSTIERVERPLLESVLARTEGNQIRAAALLGINRNTLRKKIADLGISIPRRE